MSDIEKKKQKAQAKALKKKLKYEQKLAKKRSKAGEDETSANKTSQTTQDDTKSARISPVLRFAEFVRGILYLIFSVSLVVAILSSGQIRTLTTSEIVRICIGTVAGKVVLLVIASALFIYGLKYLKPPR